VSDTNQTGYARLLEAQRAIGTSIEKTAKNPHFRSGYAPLPDVLSTVVPVLQQFDLLLIQGQQDLGRDGVIGVVTQIVDALTGQALVTSVFPMPTVDNNPQKATAAVTYGRRTGITSVLSLAERDDDGNTASEGPARPGAGGANPARKDIFG
jgi:hypothetical protein